MIDHITICVICGKQTIDYNRYTIRRSILDKLDKTQYI